MPVSRFLVVSVTIGIFGLGLATVVGLLGWWSTFADAFSHFRMHLAVASLAVAGIAAAAGLQVTWRHVVAALAIALVNLGFALKFDRAPLVAAAGGSTLKVMTVNVLYRASNDDQIVAEIAAEQADVVLFQELTKARQSLLGRLAVTHPWQISCADSSTTRPWRCDVAIVSRHPWEAAAAAAVGTTATKLAWARFGADRGHLLVASVHLQWPLISDQAAQLRAVRDRLATHAGPMVVAGDLNAAPWSAAVRGFTRQSRLRSAGGFTPTWPRRTFVHGHACAVCIPQMQIDHVFVSPQVRVLDVRTGRDVGSDHLPLIAQLEVPRAVATNRSAAAN